MTQSKTIERGNQDKKKNIFTIITITIITTSIVDTIFYYIFSFFQFFENVHFLFMLFLFCHCFFCSQLIDFATILFASEQGLHFRSRPFFLVALCFSSRCILYDFLCFFFLFFIGFTNRFTEKKKKRKKKIC